MLKKINNIILFLVGGIVGAAAYYILAVFFDPKYEWGENVLNSNAEYSVIILFIFLSAFIFNSVAPMVAKKSRRTTANIGRDLEGVSIKTVFGSTLGIIVGLIIALLISMTYRTLLSGLWYTFATLFLYIICGYFGFAVAYSKTNSDEGSEAFNQIGLLSALSEGTKRRNRSCPKIVDTSVIIDGRIAEIMKTGFIEEPILIPEFVISELHAVSDSSDDSKRARGRRGLDVLKEMQQLFDVTIYSSENTKNLDDIQEVDVKLVKLTKQLGGKLLTNDYNLNKVAQINGVEVLNINELANAIKPVVIPGEKMIVDIVKQGKERMQGVGYLDDGTMIVVEEGRNSIGKRVTILVTSIIQTSAGKMIFGKITEDAS